MKSKLVSICASVLLCSAVGLLGDDPTTSKPSSPAFDRMKQLVGSWAGEVDMGNGPEPMDMQYRLIAGGTVLEERVFAGTPNEMVTMFYEKDGQLAMTHYCLFGNRPTMLLKSASKDSITFDLDPTCGIDVKKEAHMHAIELKFVDANTLQSTCTSYMDGRETPGTVVTLKRTK